MSAVIVAMVFASLITIFGDEIRALFGQSTVGAMAGEISVEKRERTRVLVEQHRNDGY